MRTTFSMVLIALVSCNSGRVYEEFQTVESAWAEDEIYSFEFNVPNNKGTYDLVAQFKHDVSFQFTNFYFQYTLKSPSDSVLMQSLEQVIFFDPKTGKPLGKGVGGSFDHSFLMLKDYAFENRGMHRIEFQQFMRLESLENIHKVGFRLQQSDQD